MIRNFILHIRAIRNLPKHQASQGFALASHLRRIKALEDAVAKLHERLEVLEKRMGLEQTERDGWPQLEALLNDENI